jgi:hypothetical protein
MSIKPGMYAVKVQKFKEVEKKRREVNVPYATTTGIGNG